MLARNKNSADQAVGLVLVILSLFVCTIRCDQLAPRDGTFDDQQQQQQQQVLLNSGAANMLSRQNNRLLAVPRSLARFLFYNARQAGGPLGPSSVQPSQLIGTGSGTGGESVDNGGYERSSRALDAISGMTIGKRSANPRDYVNLEPIIGRQNYVVRGPPSGLYNMRWGPLETIEPSMGYRDYN